MTEALANVDLSCAVNAKVLFAGARRLPVRGTVTCSDSRPRDVCGRVRSPATMPAFRRGAALDLSGTAPCSSGSSHLRSRTGMRPYAGTSCCATVAGMTTNRIALTIRFWKYVDTTGNCWLWIGAKDQHGYGRIQRGGRNGGLVKAHRLSYEIHNGQIPTGMGILHKCDNPSCVNPVHLFAGTQKDNAIDMASKGRSAAQRGYDNGRTKITDAQVRELRELACSGVAYPTLAARYGIGAQAVSEIARGNRRLKAGGPLAPARTHQTGRWARDRSAA